MELDVKEYQKILDTLNEAIYFVDRNRFITYWNKAAEKISGYSADEVLGKSCSCNILTHVDDEGNNLCNGMCPLAETIFDKKTRDAEVFMHHKNGHRIPVAVRTSVLTDSGGNIIGGIELFTDLSEKAANEIRIRELEKLALLDYLTQLANRVYIEKELQIRIEEYKRFQIPFGIFFMDIDNFKTFNDTCGHALGDEILKCVANTFVFNARPFDLYGRWGGEEFIAIIKNIKSADLELLGNRIRMLIENTYIMHDNQKMEITISVGATQVTETDTVNSIIERADTLMYKSKAAGKNCVTSG